MKQGRSKKRRGLTLVELLVVGTIIIAVTAISIPVVKPMMESQLTKNGAGMVATALNRARNRAQVTGRACGVRFEYWPGTSYPCSDAPIQSGVDGEGIAVYTRYYAPGSSLLLRQVEVPPVYSGILGVESVKIGDNGACEFQNDIYAPKVLEKSSNAKLQINGSGPFYRFRENSTVLKGGETFALPPNRETAYPFKLLLDARATMAMPTTLPRGTAVDLEFSGTGDTIFRDTEEGTANELVKENKGITLMFAPDGSVESVNGTMPTSPIHFLIGRWDQISAVRDSEDTESYPNYADGRNYWVTVFPQTGVVTIAPVNPTEDVGYDPVTVRNNLNYEVPSNRLPYNVISISRELTR